MCLNKVGENIWCIDGEPVKMFTTPFQTRMTIVRLASGKLWLHSPVMPSEKIYNLVNEIGEVSYLVAPNTLHHLSLEHWMQVYPEAKLFGVERLPEKRTDLKFSGILADSPEPEWSGEIDQLYFRGSNILLEVAFFHKPSKTLILTDLIQNHDPRKENLFWRFIKYINGVLSPHGGVPKDLRLIIRDKEKARTSLQGILSWDFERLIISHGLCIENDAKRYVSSSFSWLKA